MHINDWINPSPVWYLSDKPSYRVPADVEEAWGAACLAAYNTGQKPVINFPIGRAPSQITTLEDPCTGELVPITWLPASRFPSDLPAQYFNPDLILRDAQ